MASGVNVRIISSKNLLEYDQLRRQTNGTWDDILWEENELESGTGSPDCETHLKITNAYPAWKELFEVQRREVQAVNDSSCDVHIHANEGYIPCHRPFLQQKSDLLDKLISENLKVNMPGNNNVISITLMDVNIENLKSVMTLLYTGSCVVADDDEEDAVKEVLRQLQIDWRKLKLHKDPIDPSTLKSKKKKWKTVKALRYQNVDGDAPHAPAPLRNVLVPASSSSAQPVPGSSNDATASVASSSGSRQIPGTSGGVSTSLEGPLSLPTFAKVPRGTLTQRRKVADRIKRNLDENGPTTSSAGGEPQDDSDGDDNQQPSSNPVFEKVKPGSLTKIKQPRIIRSATGRGRGIKRAGNIKTQTNSNGDISDQDDEGSNTPKGRYEHDSDFVLSGQEEVGEGNVNQGAEKGVVANLASTDVSKKPRTRKSAQSQPIEGSTSRYPKRQRRRNPSYPNEDDKEKETDENINSDTLHPPEENNAEGLKGARARGKGISPAGKDGSSRNSISDENRNDNVGHRCAFCGDTYNMIEDLKTHLENTCARHLTGTYDLLTKQCDTCKTSFMNGNLYTSSEFMDHVKVCVYSARPSQKRPRNASTTPGGNSAASSVKAPSVSPPEQQKQSGVQGNEETNVKQNVQDVHKESLDVMGMKKISIFMDKLQDDQIAKIMDTVRRNKPVQINRPNCPPGGYKYIFTEKGDKNPTGDATSSVPAPSSATRILDAQGSMNETLPTATASTFNPTYVSTPLTPEATNGNKANTNRVRRTGPSTRPIAAPLSVKRKAEKAAASNEKGGESNAGPEDDVTNKPRPINQVQQDNGFEKHQSNNVGQKKKDVPQTTLVPTNDHRANLLREKVKSFLRPNPPLQNASANHSGGTHADATAKKNVVGEVTTSKDNGSVSSKALSVPQASASKDGVGNKTVTTIERGQGNKAKKTKENTETSISPIVQQQQTAPITVGSFMSNAIDTIMRNSGGTVSTYTPETQPIVPERTNESIILKQGKTTSSKANTSDNQVGPLVQPLVQSQVTKTGQMTTVSQLNPQGTVQLMTSAVPRVSTPSASQPSQVLQQQRTYSSALISQPQTVVASQPLARQQQLHMMQQSQSQQQSRVPNLSMGVQQLTSETTIRTVTTSQVQGPPFVVPHQNQQQSTRQQAVGPVSKTLCNQSRVATNGQLSQGYQNLEVPRVEIPLSNPPSSNNSQPQSLMVHQQQQQQTFMQQAMSTTQYQQIGNISVSSDLPYAQNTNSSTSSVIQGRLPQAPNRSASVLPQLAVQQSQQPARPQSTFSMLQHQNQQPTGPISSLPMLQHQNQQPARPPSVLPVVQQQHHPTNNTSRNGMYSSNLPQQQFQTATFSGMTDQMGRYNSQNLNMQPHLSNQQAIMSTTQQQMIILVPNSQTYGTQDSSLFDRSTNFSNMASIQTSILGNIGSSDTTTVRLPVSAQMNPLANNRAIQMTAQQNQRQSQTFGIAVPSTSSNQAISGSPINNFIANQSNTNQVAVASNNIIRETAPASNSFLDEKEERTFKCPDCNMNFKSQERVLEHQNEGMCG